MRDARRSDPEETPATKAVVLAAGRGSRMRAGATGARRGQADGGRSAAPGAGHGLPDAAQRRAAELGLKPLVPFHGEPFLAYGLAALARAGIGEVCLVVRPDGEAEAGSLDPVREWALRAARGGGRSLRVDFAVQPRPEGSARALLAASDWVGVDPFLLVNADNLYPDFVLGRVRALPGTVLAGFRSSGLVARGGIPAERIASFALVAVDAEGFLVELVEKPDGPGRARFGPDPLVSMNCWRFTPSIFEACRRVAPSPRGEYELPAAVLELVRSEGERVTVLSCDAPVLDLTGWDDIVRVEEALRRKDHAW